MCWCLALPMTVRIRSGELPNEESFLRGTLVSAFKVTTDVILEVVLHIHNWAPDFISLIVQDHDRDVNPMLCFESL